MIITSDSLSAMAANPEDVEIDQERVDKYIISITDFFRRKGFKETALSKLVIPIIAKNKVSDCRQGCAMLGSVGTGKTILLKLASHILDVDYFDVPALSQKFSISGAPAFWNAVAPGRGIKDFILDDLGAEADARNYGNVVPIIDLIYERYSRWQDRGERLWLSSNLTAAELEKRYGNRVVDRIKEMCAITPAVGESFRK